MRGVMRNHPHSEIENPDDHVSDHGDELREVYEAIDRDAQQTS